MAKHNLNSRNSSVIKITSIVGIIIIVVVCFEVILRLFGIGNPPLYVADPYFEYMWAPNQSINRLGKKIITNEYSMRSRPLLKSDFFKILLIGDSIIHGSGKTGHDELASTILEDSLTFWYKKNIRVLNIASKGWGPDNEYGYLQKYGDFDAEIVIVVVNSGDYGDSIDFKESIGIDPGFPSKKPMFAIAELISKIAKTCGCKSTICYPANELKMSYSGAKGNGIDSIISFSNKRHRKLIFIVHPAYNEFENREYSQNGKKLLSFLKIRKQLIYEEMQGNLKKSFYRDNLHYNSNGQRYLAQELLPLIKMYISTI